MLNLLDPELIAWIPHPRQNKRVNQDKTKQDKTRQKITNVMTRNILQPN